jgi:hypothetical protein
MPRIANRFTLAASSFALLASTLLAAPIAHAGDCGADPVYERNMTGAPAVGLRVRDIACMEGSKVLTVVSAGTAVKIIGETDGWYKVKIGDTVGWMGASLMNVTSGEAKSSDKELKENAIEVKTVKEANAPVELGKKSMIGILEKDYKLVEKGNADLVKRLKDKVLLRVQKSGETWYVEKDGKLSRVKMHKKNEFKRLVDAKKEVKKEEKKQTTLGSAGTIVLIGEALPGGVKLAWNISGDGSKGFKLVKSTEANPEYPGDAAEYIDANTRSITRYGLSTKTYHFRVCRYTGNGCDTYSNDLELTIPAGEKSETSSKYQSVEGELKVEAAVLPGAVALSWTKRTSDTFQGYKVVRSTSNADLSYPTDSYIEYLPNRESLTHIDGEAIPGKTYYYRICALEGGPVTCGNVVKIVARQR